MSLPELSVPILQNEKIKFDTLVSDIDKLIQKYQNDTGAIVSVSVNHNPRWFDRIKKPTQNTRYSARLKTFKIKDDDCFRIVPHDNIKDKHDTTCKKFYTDLVKKNNNIEIFRYSNILDIIKSEPILEFSEDTGEIYFNRSPILSLEPMELSKAEKEWGITFVYRIKN